jgi:hypothetical protein
VLVVSASRVVQVGLANQAVQAASVVSENPVAQGALGNRVAPVVPVAEEPELARVVVVPRGRARRHVPAEAAGPTRLETAAPPLVRVHAGAGLVAVEAETQLARVAAVAARA